MDDGQTPAPVEEPHAAEAMGDSQTPAPSEEPRAAEAAAGAQTPDAAAVSPLTPEEAYGATKGTVVAQWHIIQEMAAQLAKEKYARAAEREHYTAQLAQYAAQLAQYMAQLAAVHKLQEQDARRAEVDAQHLALRHRELFQVGTQREALLVAAWAAEADANLRVARSAEELAKANHKLDEAKVTCAEDRKTHTRRLLEARKQLVAAQEAARPAHVAKLAAFHRHLVDETAEAHALPSPHADPASAPLVPETAIATAAQWQQTLSKRAPSGCAAQAKRAPW